MGRTVTLCDLAGINARLATGNPTDFPMDDITVEHWPVGR